MSSTCLAMKLLSTMKGPNIRMNFPAHSLECKKKMINFGQVGKLKAVCVRGASFGFFVWLFPLHSSQILDLSISYVYPLILLSGFVYVRFII